MENVLVVRKKSREYGSDSRKLLFAFFVLGFACQVTQVVFIRELAVVFRGTELSLGVALGAWFLSMALGSGIGAICADRIDLRRLFAGPMPLVMALTMPIALYLVRTASSFGLPGTQLSVFASLLMAIVVFGPFCFAAGFSFAASAHCLGDMSLLYLAEVGGCLAGGVVFHFFLAGADFSLPKCFLASYVIFACLGLSITVVFYLYARPHFGRQKLAVLATTIVLVALLCSGNDMERKTRQMQWQKTAPGQTLLNDRISRHGYLAVLDYRGQKNLYCNGLYFMGIAENDRGDAARLAHLAFVQHPAPVRVLVMGKALNGLLHEVLKYPVPRIDYCELDPMLIDLARPYLPAKDKKALADPRVNILYGDGRTLLKEKAGRYDIVLNSLPDPTSGSLNRYYTLEYFRTVKTALSKGGVLVFTLGCSPVPEGEMLKRNATVLRTLAAVFTEVDIVVGDGSALYFACDRLGRIALSADECRRRFLAREIEADENFRSSLYETWLDIDAQKQARRELLAAAGLIEQKPVIEGGVMEIPAEFLMPPGEKISRKPSTRLRKKTDEYNTDLYPRAVLSSLRISGMPSVSTSGFARFVSRVEFLLEAIFIFASVSLFSMAAFGFVWPFRACRQFSLAAATATCGFFGISIEIVLLWAFLRIYGYMYSTIGLFSAIFMAGIFGGAWLAGRCKAIRRPDLFLPAVLLAAGAYLAVLPFILNILDGKAAGVILLALNLLAGTLVGATFPAAGRLYQAFSSPGRAAGVIYGSDMSGAFLGSLAVGAFALPLWGANTVCTALAVTSFAAALAVAGNCRRKTTESQRA